MKLSEINEKLSQERCFGSRFPGRIIFTENLDVYSLLENQLKAICDVTVNVADFCRAPDTVPLFDLIRDKLHEYEGKQILLLSVGEYLRICTKRELNTDRRQFLSFWETQQSEASRTRVIMPMFSCREIFDRVIGAMDERQQDYVWTLDSEIPSESYCISAYSPQFKESIHPDANNLSDWLRDWSTLLRKDGSCSIVTIQEGNVETSFGTVNLKTINSPFSYLSDYFLDGEILSEKWENNDFWSRMVTYVSKLNGRSTFRQVIVQVLNITDFDFVSVAARWSMLDDFQKELVWLWYRAYPTEEYYSHACLKADKANDIPAKIRDEILLISDRNDSWIHQRMNAMKALRLASFDESYFVLMDKLPLAKTKLQLLTYQTHEEKAYAIKVISGLIRDGTDPVAVGNLIADDYPELFVYMNAKTDCDSSVDEYMAWYRTNKIINRYPGEFFAPVSLERYDARLKLMQKIQGKDCVSFWIDGFGVEYAPLFLHELKMRGVVPDSVEIATALLPTETDFNHQWDEQDPMTVKWNRLDSYSHKGMPDDKSYFSCIVHQLEVFSDAAKKVEELLETHEYVVITGDHGSSRFAALAFHDGSVIPVAVPNKSTVCCFGRFCELDDKSADMIALPETTKITAAINGKKYLVMNNYRHFSVSGNVAGGNTDEHDVVGEIHGGNTVEERLVPVIIVKRNHKLIPLTCKPVSEYVNRKRGHIETTLSFNQSVFSLEVSHGSNVAVCNKIADDKWKVAFDNVTTQELVLSVIANKRLLPEITLKIKTQGISKNDDPFGGMGL